MEFFLMRHHRECIGFLDPSGMVPGKYDAVGKNTTLWPHFSLMRCVVNASMFAAENSEYPVTNPVTHILDRRSVLTN